MCYYAQYVEERGLFLYVFCILATTLVDSQWKMSANTLDL